MSDPDTISEERELIQDLKAGRKAAFIAVYDRYAPVILGMLIKMVGDQNQGVSLLETTFLNVHRLAKELKDNQPSLFGWLLGIAHQVAADALAKPTAVAMPAIQLTNGQRVVTTMNSREDALNPSKAADLMPEESRSKEFLELVLVHRCTPEEAASKIGISPGMARQYLHVALKQVRARPAIN